MRVLHTSDWHLGHTLRGEVTREPEHAAFLAWLLAACAAEARLAAERAGRVPAHQAAQAGLLEAQRKAEALVKRRVLSPDAARRLEDEGRVRVAEAEGLTQVAEGARAAAAAVTALAAEGAQLAAAATADAAERTRLEAAQVAARGVRDERAHIVDELRRVAGHAHARTELRPGNACPLCGATDHPWADRGALDDVIAAATARLTAGVTALDGVAEALAALGGRAHQRAREQARVTAAEATACAAVVTAGGTWRAQLAALGELLLVDEPTSPAAAAHAAEREAAARTRLEEARDVRHQTEAAMKAVADAQGEVQVCQAALDLTTAQIAALERRLAELAATRERLGAERAARAERHAELTAALAAGLARWRAAVPAADAPAAGAPAAQVRAQVERRAADCARAERVTGADAALAGGLARSSTPRARRSGRSPRPMPAPRRCAPRGRARRGGHGRRCSADRRARRRRARGARARGAARRRAGPGRRARRAARHPRARPRGRAGGGHRAPPPVR